MFDPETDNTSRDIYGRPYIEQDVSDEYKDGFYSYRDGWDRTACKYEGQARKDWLAGWDDAQERDAE